MVCLKVGYYGTLKPMLRWGRGGGGTIAQGKQWNALDYNLFQKFCEFETRRPNTL